MTARIFPSARTRSGSALLSASRLVLTSLLLAVVTGCGASSYYDLRVAQGPSSGVLEIEVGAGGESSKVKALEGADVVLVMSKGPSVGCDEVYKILKDAGSATDASFEGIDGVVSLAHTAKNGRARVQIDSGKNGTNTLCVWKKGYGVVSFSESQAAWNRKQKQGIKALLEVTLEEE